MKEILKNKNCLITGATGGIGQEIADKWPKSINDNEARKDWNWKPKYDLKSMTLVMLEKLEEKYNTTTLK